MIRFIYGCILMLFCGYSGNTFAQTPDIILTHGKIFTSDTNNLYAEAIAIKGNRIQAVGTSIAIENLAGNNTRRIDLKGKTVIPGINDAHDHIGYGAPIGRFISFSEPILPGPTWQQVLDSVAVAVKQVVKGSLIHSTIGLQIIEDSSARRSALDKVAPDHPVILGAPWGHGTLLNSAAMKKLNISETAADPVGGYYERIKGSQQISGLLREYAEFSIMRQWHNTVPDKDLVQVFRNYNDNAIRLGITSVQNMATSLELDKMVSVLTEANLSIRVRVIRFPSSTVNGRQIEEWSKQYPSTPNIYVSGMKWILDATPLERGALMRNDYSDKKGWKGQLNFPLDTMQKLLQEGYISKEQLMLHIVGDATPEILLSQMLRIGNEKTWSTKRVRFEHADGLMSDYWNRVGNMGIVTVVNPVHFSFAEVNSVRIGKKRAALYQPLRSLIEAGLPVAIGSDGPNNPYLNIMFAATHPTNPKEAITREQAVIAYTNGSAYAEFKENEKGILKQGLLADLAVLSQNIFSIPLQALPGTVSVLTIIGGKIVYEYNQMKKP